MFQIKIFYYIRSIFKVFLNLLEILLLRLAKLFY